MSRPKGSKNKKKNPKKINKINKVNKIKKVLKAMVSEVPKKRGRPKGSTNKKKPSTKSEFCKPTPELPPLPKAYKFIGYCSKCNSMITTKDLISKFIYVCNSCAKRASRKTLKSQRKSKKYTNKKEYLDVAVINHHETLPLNEVNELESIKVDT